MLIYSCFDKFYSLVDLFATHVAMRHHADVAAVESRVEKNLVLLRHEECKLCMCAFYYFLVEFPQQNVGVNVIWLYFNTFKLFKFFS